MRIKDLFKKDIFRPINGVVKADQLDELSVWQELEEFVVTKELEKHVRAFFTAYCASIDRPSDADIAGSTGVWVSGFFGSGKSHLIKVLAYLLDNRPRSHQGQTKRPVEFFESKIKDPLLFADIKRAVGSNTDVILFNIDTKADTKASDAILSVFLKVLNETQGYTPDHPHIAHMERYLDSKGKLECFRQAFLQASGQEWRDERDAYEFHRDGVIQAWMVATGQSKEAAEKWIDGAEGNFTLSVENFTKWVKEYLEKKGPGHRIIFLVDEVGQFIGTDTRLMLNLQTITENLGVACQGRAHIVVTSQEDIDAVLGEMRASRANDFSKIQGRFRTRLSLSSANVDEVIQERLLSKPDDVHAKLLPIFERKGDVLKQQLTFSNVGMTFKQYRDSDDFARNYPFAPYQFQLVQKIFEAIRRAGATGLHLSRGERSVLDAFQSAARSVAEGSVGLLVPLYRFYPSIESFLDTAVKRTIEQASENSSLKPFDIELLKVLFLVRYVDEIRANVDNLVTLCLDEIDADKFALRRTVEESLQRLEKETLISRSGDNYFFLTNEERDINREIKGVDLVGGEEAKLLGELVFEDVLKGTRKHRYAPNKMDFTFNRFCDGRPVGNRVDGALNVWFVTPLADEYSLYNDQKCVLESGTEGGQVFVRLDDREALGREVRAYLKTDKYLRTKDDGTLPPSTRRIHRELAEDNRERRERISHALQQLLGEASFFAAGQKLKIKSDAPIPALTEALDYLVTNTFSKIGYLDRLTENPMLEIQAVLRSDDVAQGILLKLQESNAEALKDVRAYIELNTKISRQVVLNDMIEKRYALRPYGWPELEVVLLVARLLATGEIALMMDGAALPPDKAYEPITTAAKRRKITVLKRLTSDPEAVKKARKLGNEIFSEMGPDGEDLLCAFLRAKLVDWQTDLQSYRALADTGKYPGGSEIADALTVIKGLLSAQESYKFIERFNETKANLVKLRDNHHDVEHFYEHQRPAWEKLRAAFDRFNLNRLILEQDAAAAKALQRMDEILKAPAPYSFIKEADSLINKVQTVNSELLARERASGIATIDARLSVLRKEIEAAAADPALLSVCLSPLEQLRQQVEREESTAHIAQAVEQAERLTEAGFKRIEEWSKKRKGDDAAPAPKPRHVIRPCALVSKEFLETAKEVDEFVGRLKSEMDRAISQGERIQIK